MSDPWNDRAEAYRSSVTHATDADLDIVVEMCDPHEGVKVLDVATGGGHVARRLRERGAEVVTTDPAPGMQPDVDLPRRASAVRGRLLRRRRVADRAAPLRGRRPGRGRDGPRRQQARSCSRTRSTRHEEVERAERLRDPSHVRSYTEDEWRGYFEAPASRSSGSRASSSTSTSTTWLARTGCDGEDAERVRELLAPWSVRGRIDWNDRQRCSQGEEVADVDGDHRRPRHEARRPGADRLRGPLPRAAQPRLRHEPRRRRHARQGRPGRRGRAGLRHGRRRPSARRARTRR